MGTIYRFIADPSQPNPITEWFNRLAKPPEPVNGQDDRGLWLYFRHMGALSRAADGSLDVRRSPLVTVFPPRVRRGILWTVGEVHFLPTPLRETFPELHKVSMSLKGWLESFSCVYSNKPGHQNDWNYYLEGAIKNFDPPVYALGGSVEALQRGQYFVAEDDNDAVLDKLCAKLRLRDVHCK
jgi:hypothetical protein